MPTDTITPYALLWELSRKRGWRLKLYTEQIDPHDSDRLPGLKDRSRLSQLVLSRPGKNELALDLDLYEGSLDAAADEAFDLLKAEGAFSPRSFGGLA